MENALYKYPFIIIIIYYYTFCVPPFKLDLESSFSTECSNDLSTLSPKVALFNLTTFGLIALLTVLRSQLVLVFVVGEVASMETEFIPLFIESR